MFQQAFQDVLESNHLVKDLLWECGFPSAQVLMFLLGGLCYSLRRLFENHTDYTPEAS